LAAVAHDDRAGLLQIPVDVTGLDGAVRTLGNQPFGQVLITLVGLGLAAYGVYSFARATYARV
jgi:hypothetical protein